MSKDELQSYIDEGLNVFHGTADGNITQLEPRQALSFNKPDGAPAVFAASRIEPAIFMAILGSRRLAGWDSSKFIRPYGFFISETNWKKAKEQQLNGYVYVLDRQPFQKGLGWVWRSEQSVKPLAKVAVSFTDLPENITILEDQEESDYVKFYS